VWNIFLVDHLQFTGFDLGLIAIATSILGFAVMVLYRARLTTWSWPAVCCAC
jgi:hypothetical protein